MFETVAIASKFAASYCRIITFKKYSITDIITVAIAKPAPILTSRKMYSRLLKPDELENFCREYLKYQKTITVPEICARTVADAAPLMPQSNTIINSASRIMFIKTVEPTR